MDKLIVFSEEELIVIRNKGINHVYAQNGSSQFKRALLLLYFLEIMSGLNQDLSF